MSSRFLTICIVLLIVIGATEAYAANNTTLIYSTGPEIHGEVNTLTNTFTVTSWVENPGGSNWWTPAPSSLPLTYTALTPSGAVFDVPDNWNGIIFGWAFICDLTNAAIQWNEGTYTSDTVRHHGWGGSIGIAGTVILSATATYAWDNTPVGNNGFGTFTFTSVHTIPEPASLGTSLLGAGALLFRRPRRCRGF